MLEPIGTKCYNGLRSIVKLPALESQFAVFPVTFGSILVAGLISSTW